MEINYKCCVLDGQLMFTIYLYHFQGKFNAAVNVCVNNVHKLYAQILHQITPDTTILQRYTMLLIVHLGHCILKHRTWTFMEHHC